MVLNDLTVILLTINRVPEGWAEYQKSVLLEAIGDTSVITISKKPLDWGLNLIQDAKPSVNNIYRQVLRGAKHAKTPYIAIAEDDHLYPYEHFLYRPPMDEFGYEMSRWGLFTWGKPTFYFRPRISNGSMIAPRELVIKALEERFKKRPNSSLGEVGKEKGTRLSYKGRIYKFRSTTSTIFLSHVNSLDPLEQRKKKRMTMAKAYEIPHWGRAEDIIKKWK